MQQCIWFVEQCGWKSLWSTQDSNFLSLLSEATSLPDAEAISPLPTALPPQAHSLILAWNGKVDANHNTTSALSLATIGVIGPSFDNCFRFDHRNVVM